MLNVTNAVYTGQRVGEHVKNNVKTQVQGTALGVAGGAAIIAAAKNDKFATKLAAFADKLLSSKVGKKASAYVLKAVDYLKANPKVAKAVGLIAAPVLLIGGILQTKHDINAGKIEQKYADKLELKEQLEL